jgi:arsenical pump membrane protein
MGASALGLQLGLPTCLAGVATTVIVLARTGERPWTVLRGVSWGVLPLVGGLFVLVQAVDATGLLQTLATALTDGIARSPSVAAGGAGVAPPSPATS